MLSANRNSKQLNIGRIFPFRSIFSRFDIYYLPASKSLQRLQSFLISHVVHLKSFVTFVQARLDGACTSESIFLEPENIVGIFFSKVMGAK